ncbi:MAG: hydroxyacid dehydrogenase [Chloroflexota bacterium]
MYKIWIGMLMDETSLQTLSQAGELIGPHAPTPSDDMTLLETANAVIAGPQFPGTAVTFNRCPNLKAVIRAGAGYDSIDLDAATAHGICVANTPDAHTESTAVFTISLLLSVVRQVGFGHAEMAKGEWPHRSTTLNMDLNNKILGIVGLGRIGSRVAELAHAFGLRVHTYDPYIAPGYAFTRRVEQAESLEVLLNMADIVTLHTPLNNETRHMMDASRFTQMKRGAILLNASRGPVVVETDLIDALRSGHLGGAGLDVWNPEPPDADNPLRFMNNVVATPHMAANTREGRARSRADAAKQVLQVLVEEERPFALLNPDVWPIFLEKHKS